MLSFFNKENHANAIPIYYRKCQNAKFLAIDVYDQATKSVWWMPWH